jgi:hypothetical protein
MLIGSDELIVILKPLTPAPSVRAARGPRRKVRARVAVALRRWIIDRITRPILVAMSACLTARNDLRLCSLPRQTPRVYFRGLPRFGKINPHVSAVQRSRLANLSASLRSGPGGIRRANSKASAARVSQSSLSVERCVSLLIAPQSSCYMDSSKSFDSKTQICVMLFPASIFSTAYGRRFDRSRHRDHQNG